MPRGVYDHNKLRGKTYEEIYGVEKAKKLKEERTGKAKKLAEQEKIGWQKGCTPWNKGLTKQTDERVRRMADAISKAMKGVNHSKEVRKKISETLIGHEVTEETRKKISDAMNAFANTDYGKQRHHEMRLKQWANDNFREERANKVTEDWKNPEFQEKMRRARDSHPNKFEKDFEEQFPTLQFVGDYSFFVGSKNPDFIVPNTDLCIDLFGDYWHEENQEIKRTKYFEKHGKKLLIVWESEWNEKREHVVQQVEQFLEAKHNA